MSETITIAPQPGFQEKVLGSPADILICGGSSGPGKTFCLLLEPIRHYLVRGFYAVIFRRTYPQIENPGGLWDKSMNLYPYIGGIAKKSSMEWAFADKSGRQLSKIVFRHMQNEDDWQNYQGTEIPYFGFDELTQFERSQFFKILAWNRSTCGVKPYVRATCNPDPDSFVAELIEWYLRDDGFPDPEKDGKLRYFVTIEDSMIWGDSKPEVYEKAKSKLDQIPIANKMDLIKSFSFIKGEVYENRKLLDSDPQYIANLLAMSEEEQLRFLGGNWKIKISKEIIFNHVSFSDCFTNDFVEEQEGYITADIATTGRDVFVISYWRGKVWRDVEFISKNSGKEAIEKIDEFRNKYRVVNSHILFDADGVGGGMTGWIEHCVEFHGNATPIGKINYRNLKSQCFIELANSINQKMPKTPKDLYYIHPDVARKVFEGNIPALYRGRTIRWILEHQMKAIRIDKPELGSDQKLAIIKKDEQKSYLSGISPDFIEQMMFREYFELHKAYGDKWATIS